MRLEHDPVNIWCRRSVSGWSWSVDSHVDWMPGGLTDKADTFTKAASSALLAFFDATVPKVWHRPSALALFTGESTFALYMSALRGYYALGDVGVDMELDEYIESMRAKFVAGRYVAESRPTDLDEFCALTRELVATLTPQEPAR